MRHYTWLLVLAVIAPAATVFAADYSGSLSSQDGGILGTGSWIYDTGDPDWHPAILSWSISRNPDDSWHYEYEMTVSGGDISHFIIEVSDTFESDDFFNPSGPYQTIELETFFPGAGNPNMPSPFYGIKFDSTSGDPLAIQFDSWRAPTWGDFYTKDGNSSGEWNTAWNAGFTDPDSDPLVAPSDGSLLGHILVPDTYGDPIPEPATGALVLMGLTGLAVRLRRRSNERTKA